MHDPAPSRPAIDVRRAWRHRRAALATAWLGCLIGWSGILLLPEAPAASLASATAATAPALPAPPAPGQRAREAAALRAELEAALAVRTAQARELGEIPRLLASQPNPVHQQRRMQLDLQDALIATLRERLAELRIADEDRWRAADAAGARRTGDPAPPGAPPKGRSGPAALIDAPRLVALCAVLLLAVLAGTGLAVWRGRHDGILDHPTQLQEPLALAVLCTIDLPASPARAAAARADRRGVVLAGLALAALLAGLVAADRLGILAPLAGGAGRAEAPP